MRRRRGGFASITVIFIVTVFAVMGMAAVALISGSTKRMEDEYHSQQAFEVAQAGVSFALKALTVDFDWSDNTGYFKQFGPGRFDISYPQRSADSITVRSDGTVEGIKRSITQEATRSGGGILAFSSAIYTEQDILVSGQAHTNVSGDVVSGGSVSGSGQARLDIAGDLDTNTGVRTTGQSHVGVSGETSTGYDTAQIPDPDWGYWSGHADHVVDGNMNMGSGQGTFTYNGIYYVTGNVTISGQANVIVNGTIITRGGFSLSGQSRLTVHPSGDRPAIVAEGTVSMSGQSIGTFDIDGWILSSSQVNLSGQSNLAISGGIVAGDDISLSGQATFDITYHECPSIGFSGGESDENAGVVKGVWQEAY